MKLSPAQVAAYSARTGLSVPGGETPAKGNKYRSKKTEYNGTLYHSKLEAMCAAQLDALMALGFVSGWKGQVRYQVGPKIFYVADFVVEYAQGTPRVIDAKGVQTDVFKIKRKLFEAAHGPLDVVMSWQEMPTEGR